MSAAPESVRTETAIRDRRAATIDELGETAVTWLAAPPVWSLWAAEISGFPVSSVSEFVRLACTAGLCKVRGSLNQEPAPDLLFWVPDEIRREIFDVLRPRWYSDEMLGRVAKVAGRGEMAISLDPAAPPRSQYARPGMDLDDEPPGALRVWTELLTFNVRERGLPAVAQALVERTEQAVGRRRLGDAQDLVAAGEALAAAFAGPFEQALSRARRLLALGLRRRQDERALGHYQDRPELTAAVARLLHLETAATQPEPPGTAAPPEAAETPWALHLLGAGGVGKTMLIRYLAAGQYARARGLPPIPVARADFDHISPDYPVRRPVQLLLELADELALHTAASDRADRALTAFRTRAARAHEAVSGMREAGGSPLDNPEVARAVEGFGIVLAELGDVLLILDTCEELAKADLGDPAAPAVRATLDIVERLHERAPSVRVLFAGRRPLPARPYLTVRPVAGFTVAEARDYLATATRRLPAGLADAMIRQSPAVDGPALSPGQLPARVSPFDLALYAAWADEDPGLEVAEVERGSDAYIEGRIIERLDDPLVVAALPVLAVAGRCRVETVAEFIGAEPIGTGLMGTDPAALGRRLAAQEWIDAVGDPPVHVMARPALALRLRRYFSTDERRAEFAARNGALAAVLLGRLRDSSLADVDVDELITALRLAAPPDAAALWDAIAEQAAQPPGRWSTVLNITGRILGEWDEEAWPTTPALRATVVAAHIAASRRDSPLFDPRDQWETVRAWAGRHPDPVAGKRLAIRAALGLLPEDDRSAWDLIAENLDRDVPDELAAAAVDAAHRMLESGRPFPRTDAELLLKWTHEIRPRDPWIRAWASVAQGRLLADVDGDIRTARVALDDAERTIILARVEAEAAARVRAAFSVSMKFDQDRGVYVASDSHFPAAEQEREPPRYAELSPSSWPDWLPPDDLLARVRVEYGLTAPPDDLSVLDAWESYATPRLGSIDAERLASLCLRIRLRHGVIAAAVAERWESDDSYVPGRSPTCTAHDLVPPLAVSIAQAWLAAGQPDRALALLSRRRSAALGTRRDEDTVRHTDAATVSVLRRLRLLDDQLSTLLRLADGRSTRAAALAALRTLAILGRIPSFTDVNAYMESPDGWHARWQADGLGMLDRLTVVRPTVAQWGPPSSSAEAADIRADLEELWRLPLPKKDGAPDRIAFWVSTVTQWLAQPTTQPPFRSAAPYPQVRAAMRLAALAGDEFSPPLSVPRRLLAEMAFEEAELTALRLAEPAVRLFMAAADAYAASGDLVGVLLARLSIRALVTTIGPASGLPSPAAARRAADAALLQVATRDKELGAMLGSPEDAGLWRYWAERIQATEADRPTAAPGSGSPPPGAQPQNRLTQQYPLTQQDPLPQQDPPPGFVPSAHPDPCTFPSAPGPGSRAPRRARSCLLPIALTVTVGVGALIVLLMVRSSTHPASVSVSATPSISRASPHPSGRPSRSKPSSAHPTPTPGRTKPHPTAPPTAPHRTPTPPPHRSPTPSPHPTLTPTSKEPVNSAPASSSAGGLVTWIIALAVAVAALAALLGWYVPKVVRLTRRRGLGVVRPGLLLIDITPFTIVGSVRIDAHLRPWSTAPARVRAALCCLIPGVWLIRRFGGSDVGYRANLSPPNALEQRPQSDARSPLASSAWWRKGSGSPLGIIRTPVAQADSSAWERIVAPCLGTAATGRIEWIRLVSGTESRASSSAASVLLAPPAWERSLHGYYAPSRDFTADLGLRHVIGLAVDSSAGPAMQLPADDGSSDTALSGQTLLLTVQDLKLGQPAIVILQAEPDAADAIAAVPPDDQAEKLRLGADLAADGVPAVLLLPVLPDAIAGELAQIITAHMRHRQGATAQVLLTRLRAAIAPHVPPSVLDDVVLFLNETRYRS